MSFLQENRDGYVASRQPTLRINASDCSFSEDDRSKASDLDDPDYVPAAKRHCTETAKKANKTSTSKNLASRTTTRKNSASSDMRTYFGPQKRLSPSERVARLHGKFNHPNAPSAKEKTTKNRKKDPNSIVHTVKARSPTFESQKEKNAAVGASHVLDIEQLPIHFDSFDHLLAFEDVSSGPQIASGSSKANANEINIVNDLAQLSSATDINELKECIMELTGKITLLSKQVARLEMKSIGVRTSADRTSIEPEMLLDFDSTLRSEGFPIADVAHLGNFERKLQQDTKYREKMVRHFVRLPT